MGANAHVGTDSSDSDLLLTICYVANDSGICL